MTPDEYHKVVEEKTGALQKFAGETALRRFQTNLRTFANQKSDDWVLNLRILRVCEKLDRMAANLYWDPQEANHFASCAFSLDSLDWRILETNK